MVTPAPPPAPDPAGPDPADPDPADPRDPVVVRRAEIARWVGLAKRVGYGLLLLAIVAFAVAAIAGFPNGLVTVTVVALIAACVVLPIPIVMGYGVRAAEREDRDERIRRAGGEPPSARH